jgi:hypothetical protein
MADHENASLGFGNRNELVFRMAANDIFRKVLIWSVQLGRLVNEMEYTQRVKLKKVYYWFVVLKTYIVCELFQTFSEEFILFLFEYV